MSRRAERHPASVSALLTTSSGQYGEAMAAEIGVFRGKTSAVLLTDHPNLLLYMIDPWRPFGADSEYARTGDYMAIQSEAVCENNYQEALKVTDFAKDRRIVLRDLSCKVVELFEDEAFDLVFIDAEHSYPAVKQDISLWWPKVRVGGVLCGHDYSQKAFPGVVQAVDEWAASIGTHSQFMPGWVWYVRK